ncbi:hypothetical protein FFI39_009540 [Janthinobacterium sp. KBS0711]|uniref:hypothetical protein n=1 Tax=Janthinobacterium sp. KBS0711 TaxID=1649647 RepID=UPI00110DFE46|nr:hypothetical protein [Janthinobacterium sp. KBS0711]TSD71218.1 hypothetical protein FFI39_009540 [Janthinobacterium sp. KBS0711]
MPIWIVNMLLPSRWNKHVCTALVGFLVAGVASARATTLDKDRTRGDIHGLFEIRDAAVKFMAAENSKNGTSWQVLEPNRKILVAKCAVALRVKWVPKSHGLSGPNVAVSCDKTVTPTIQPKWEVFVPVDKGAVARK